MYKTYSTPLQLCPLLGKGNEITGEVWNKYLRPCIYLWKRGQQYLYIGQSQNGVERFLSTKHHVIGILEPVLDTDEFKFYFPEIRASDTLDYIEYKLIKFFKPVFNVTHNNNKDYRNERKSNEKPAAEDMPVLPERIHQQKKLAEILHNCMQESALLEHSHNSEDSEPSREVLEYRLAQIRHARRVFDKLNKKK